MQIQLKTIFGDVIIEGDFSSIADAVKAAIAGKKSLRSANLRSADLRSADLRSADLRSADLRYADLRSANLSYADLSSADLRSANLRSANLSYADLSYADLSSADLRSANLRQIFKALPDLKNPDAMILAAIENGGKLEMSDWHKCETTHCRAGWYIQLAGSAGTMLEAVYGAPAAGAIIFTKAYPTKRVPDFYADNDAALADIRANATA